MALDIDGALRMTPDAEKFLRILIEMWLERNAVVDPDIKEQTLVEASDAENRFSSQHGLYQLPSIDSLHGLLVLVNYLLARKVDADVTALAQSRSTRLLTPPFCLALDALHQPLFIFLSLVFRQPSIPATGWTEFLLAVELWLAWINPDRTWKNTFTDRGNLHDDEGGKGRGAGARWRQKHLKAYVTSNFHFYTTLFALFMRKARAALGSEPSRQYLALCQVLRVMQTFHDTALRDVLGNVSRSAADLWRANNNSRGKDYMLYHFRSLRLGRSRPCLLSDACQDAQYLAAELQLTRKRGVKALEDSRTSWSNVTGVGWLLRVASSVMSSDLGQYAEYRSSGMGKLPALIQKVGGSFVFTRLSCRRCANTMIHYFLNVDR